MEGREALVRADDLIAGVEIGEYNGVGISARNMINMYHLLLHGEGVHARAEGGSGGGSGVGRMDAVLMRIVDGSEGGADGIGGGAGSQVITARPAWYLFHVVIKAYVDLEKRFRTFKEQQRCADHMEEIVKIVERKSGVGGNGVTPSVIM